MAGKRHQSKQPNARITVARQVTEAIDQAREWIERRRFDDALQLLRTVDRQFPNNPMVLSLMGEAAHELDDNRLFLDVADRLVLAVPDDPEVLAQRAYAYLRLGFAFLGHRYFTQLIQRWPDSPLSDKARLTLPDVQPALDETTRQMQEAGYAVADVPELSSRHEQIQVYLLREKYADARRLASQVLSRWPTFAPAVNNVVEAWTREGNLAQAVAATRQALAIQPDNTFALAGLVRLLVLGGNRDEASTHAERLLTLPVLHPDHRIKMAEALALLGDDAGVLAVWAGGEQAGFRVEPIHLAYLHHLAAVAAYRSGDEKRARSLWAACLRAAPNFSHASACIDDLDKPAGERNGPYPCPIDVLLADSLLAEIARVFGDAQIAVQETKATAEARRFLQQRPHVVPLLGVLLDCGNAFTREIACRIAGAARTPQTLALLSEFSASPRGPDVLRIQAAQALFGTEFWTGPMPKLWIRGERRPFRLVEAEISANVMGKPLAARIQTLLERGTELLRAGAFTEAESLLRQALALAPDSPGVKNNLATTLTQLGRDAEAQQLFQEIFDKHPDYLFGVLQQARKRIAEGELTEAKRLLDSVSNRPRLHETEFSVVVMTSAVLARGNLRAEEEADWVALLGAVCPDDPNLSTLRSGQLKRR